ncbi:lipopolysaccharide biosynthesis protein [Salegentibacter chungangensis]|uniref:Lipopolysaccharide biosynthesis protein n=1 Tax=Salegentibacter chungangensis TaxID=1335724 RepID=A0ABW3NU60_9FLAO
MGIVIKQSFKNLVTTYFGFGIGAINTLFLFTYFLEQQYYGLVSFLLSAANLIWPFMAFGVNSTLVKFYTSYKTRGERDKLLNMILFLPLIVSGILGLIGFLSYDLLLKYFSDENQLVQPYIWLIFVIATATAYFEVFFSWTKVFYKSVLGNFMKEVFHRFCVSVLLVAVYLDLISIPQFIYGVASVFVFRTLVMGAYAFMLYTPRIRFRFPENYKVVLKYTSLILIAASVAMVLLDLDKVMIEYYLPIENVAVYGIAVYIATVISVPSKAMQQITNPMTAGYLNNGDRESLKDLYTKSSLNLLVVSGVIFTLIITNLEQLYEMIPDEYEISVLVVLLISLIKLYDNLLGNNNSILFNSDYYRIVLAIGVLLAITAFLLNLVFIPWLGIIGASIATFIAFCSYNTFKVFLVYRKFRLHPFTSKTWQILLSIAVFCIGFYFWDFPFHPILNIALKSAMICAGFIFLAYKFRFSEEVSVIVGRFLK